MTIAKGFVTAAPETPGTVNPPPEAVHPTAANVPEAAKAQAERLVEQLGSIDLAKQAVDAIAEQSAAASIETDLHRTLGFRSHQHLIDASSLLESNDGKKWFITQLPDESWVAWNEADHKCDRHFTTAEEALASVPHEAEFTGTSLLG